MPNQWFYINIVKILCLQFNLGFFFFIKKHKKCASSLMEKRKNVPHFRSEKHWRAIGNACLFFPYAIRKIKKKKNIV